MLPIILIFILTVFSIFSSEDPGFSFQKTYEYNLERSTIPHKVRYFVNSKKFNKNFNKYQQEKLEIQVEKEVVFFINEYLHHIRNRCNQEKETQAHYIRQASGWFSVDQEKLNKANQMHLPNCDELRKWYLK